MGIEDTHRLGYRRVDDDANVSVLVSTMDATAGWEATRRLRSWERGQLNLTGGQRLLDVGCGLGEAALALAGDLDDDGELVGIDLSAEMLASPGPRRPQHDVACASPSVMHARWPSPMAPSMS